MCQKPTGLSALTHFYLYGAVPISLASGFQANLVSLIGTSPNSYVWYECFDPQPQKLISYFLQSH